MSLLDIFDSDAFSLRTMTKNILKIPPNFNYLGSIPGLFDEVGSSTVTVMVEEQEGKLALVGNSKRGKVGETLPVEKRKVRPFLCSHKQINDQVLADQVIGVRLFGSETEMQTPAVVVADRLQTAAQSLDLTLEYMRVGAVQGYVRDADGSIVTDMFDEFQQSRYTEKWNVSKDTSDGELKRKCNALIRRTMKVLGGTPVREFHILCGDDLFDALETCSEIRDYIKYFPRPEGDFLLDSHAYRYFMYAGVKFVNYLGYVGEKRFIDADKAYFLPVGVPDMFTVNYAPADYTETVNTVGVRYYAKQERLRFDKGIEIECQTNPLVLCTRPAALCEITLAGQKSKV